MKGLIARTLTGVCAAGLVAITGCGSMTYSDLVDPCYPQRYEKMSRDEANAVSAPQIDNGHVLDQTVRNYDFDPGTDRLTPGGLEHLKYLARRRPHADPMIYLQTAQDVNYDPAAPERFAMARADLNGRRTQAIMNFLNANGAGSGQVFQVAVHDPAEGGLSGTGVARAIQGSNYSFVGTLAGGTSGGTAPTGGAVSSGGGVSTGGTNGGPSGGTGGRY
jgi:hypothetical protein